MALKKVVRNDSQYKDRDRFIGCNITKFYPIKCVCAISFQRTRENLFKPNFVNVLVFINRTTFGIRVPLNLLVLKLGALSLLPLGASQV